MHAAEAKYDFAEFFVNLRAPRTASHFLRVYSDHRLQLEMSLANENRPGYISIDHRQKRNRPGFYFERPDVLGQREIVVAVGLAQAHVAQLAIHRIGICEGCIFFGHRHAGLLRRDR